MASDSVHEGELGRTILVEERTSIWCTSCAEIDPQLEIVAKSHRERTAIIALHTLDEFENDASRARMEYQNLTDDNQYGTPTFFVDGEMTAEGYDAWSDVQDRILSQESLRSAPEQMSFSISNGNIEYDVPSTGQLSIMVIQHDKDVPEDAENPGEDHRDRVLVGLKVVESDGNSSTYGDLNLPEHWSVVFVHEPIEGGEPYGVLELSNQAEEEVESASLAIAILLCIAVGSLLILVPDRKFLNPEEE